MKIALANIKTDEVMTLSAVADYLRRPPAWIYTQLRERQIPAFKIGGDWRFEKTAIDEWLRKFAAGPKL